MAHVIGGCATSHAFALMDPAGWDSFLPRSRGRYRKLMGREAPETAGYQAETLADNQTRYETVRRAHRRLQAWLGMARPDLLILIGDDQDEHFDDSLHPPYALFMGEGFTCRAGPDSPARSYSAAPSIAVKLHERMMDAGFELAPLNRLEGGELKAHAFGPVLERILPTSAPLPAVLPLFVDSIHYPAPSPGRCHALGRCLRDILAALDPELRVAFCASGGLSHFSGFFPYHAYDKRHGYDFGDIAEAFDRKLLALMEQGKDDEIAAFSSRDLLENGDGELRSWLVGLGLAGQGAKAEILAYEPFYRAIMGMGVALWDQCGANATNGTNGTRDKK